MHKIKTLILYGIIIGIITGLGSSVDNQVIPIQTEEVVKSLPLPFASNIEDNPQNPFAQPHIVEDDVELLDFDYYLYPDQVKGGIVLHAELRSASGTIPDEVFFHFNEGGTALLKREVSEPFHDYYGEIFYSKNISDSYLFVGSVEYPNTAGNYTYNLTAMLGETTHILTNGTINILSTILEPTIPISPYDFYDFYHVGYEVYHNTFKFSFTIYSPYLPEGMDDFAVIIDGQAFPLEEDPLLYYSSLRSFRYQHDFGLLDSMNHTYYFRTQYMNYSYTSDIKSFQTTAKTSGEVRLRVYSYPTSDQDY